jgi:small-conductance mechanosensitive channel
MKTLHKIAGIVLAILLVAAGYGIFRTEAPAPAPPAASGVANALAKASGPGRHSIGEAPLRTAQQLAALVTLPEERALAQEALRLADHEVGLALTAALHQAVEDPPPLSAEAKKIQARLQKAEDSLTRDQARVTQLTDAVGKATPDKKDALDDQLDLAKAQQELDQDEVDGAKQDLIRAGGDPTARIQAMLAEHEASAHATETAMANATTTADEHGLLSHIQEWMALHRKQLLLWRALHQAQEDQATLAERHKALIDQSEGPDAGTTTQGQHAATPAATTSAQSSPATAAPATASSPPKPNSAANSGNSGANREQSAALVTATKQRSAKQKRLATLDRRMDDESDLADVYTRWIAVVAAQQRIVLNRALRGVVIILVIALLGLFIDGWITGLLGKTKLDRRQMETLRAVSRVSLQVLGVLFILLVIFGPPRNFGTFLGLAGAGLTVALKDFIVGFLGWFVLMGKNGIRLGDWVEINGVTGEVVELGMFHTVLLETGNWTDSGHPTGRRVTFTNSFAIEGHYFNFSTSGQWLWDELQVVLPIGQDPYPIVDAIQKKVQEATAESGRRAEQEWRSTARSKDMSNLSAAPAINVKPVIGGTQISIRYITNAHDRFVLRSKLNQILVDLLGGKAATTASESPTPAPAPNTQAPVRA